MGRLGHSRGYFLRPTDLKISHSLDPHSSPLIFRSSKSGFAATRFKSHLLTQKYSHHMLRIFFLILRRRWDSNPHAIAGAAFRERSVTNSGHSSRFKYSSITTHSRKLTETIPHFSKHTLIGIYLIFSREISTTLITPNCFKIPKNFSYCTHRIIP